MKRLQAILAALFVLSAQTLLAQAALGTFQYTTAYSQMPLNGYVAILDLSSGALAPVVTSLASNCTSPSTVFTTTTMDFATKQGTFIAITANTGKALSSHSRQAGDSVGDTGQEPPAL